MVYYCGLWFLYWRWVAAPTQVNAYYAPPFNQFGKVIEAYTVAIYMRINFEGTKKVYIWKCNVWKSLYLYYHVLFFSPMNFLYMVHNNFNGYNTALPCTKVAIDYM